MTAVLGAIGLTCAAAAAALGLTPLIVVGASMEPSIPLGSLVVTRQVPSDRVQVGDVISVERPNGARVTHRVVESAAVTSDALDSATGDLATDDPARAGTTMTEFTLRGDANPSPDATRPVVANADRVQWVIPGLGSALRWLHSPLVAFVLGLGVAGALWSSVSARHRPVAAVMWSDGIPHRLVDP